jgi:phage tail-like protein
MPAFHFQVDWGGSNLGFSEVSGLNIEQQVIEYRDGLSPEYSSIKMPGIRKYGNITLKRGIIKKDNEFFAWLNTTKMNKVERRDLVIKLLDEEHNPVMVWSVKNAWPAKVDSPTLKADGNEVAIETLEIAHEGVTIENE